MDNDQKKYDYMEALLQTINRDFISISEEEKKRNTEILRSLVNQITDKMKEKDSLFKEMFTVTFYGGSFYDGLKVANPDQYKLDLLLKLPSVLKYEFTVASDIPGFVLIHFLDWTSTMQKLDLQGKHKGIDELISTTCYLDIFKVSQWVQNVILKALNDYEKDSKGHYIFNTNHGKFYAKILNSGSAFTLTATGTVGSKEINMDIDLIPCFVFSKERWPHHFRINTVKQKPNFFILPKPIEGLDNSDHQWRLSFQEQERHFLDKKETLKTTIKFLKKMRDILNHKVIASYYIKTVAMLAISDHNIYFWNNSLSYIFMTLLKDYQSWLRTCRIPYFWNKSYNLLEKINQQTLIDINSEIKAVIDDIERHLEEPLVVAKYLVTPEEMLKLKDQCGF